MPFACANQPVAAPATVSGEPAPKATGRIRPGRRRKGVEAASQETCRFRKNVCRAGCSGQSVVRTMVCVDPHAVFDIRTRDHCKGAETILLDITSTSSSLNEKTDRDTAPGVVVYVCRSCRSEADPNADPRPGATLAQAAVALGQAEGVDVRSVNCLANCKRGLSAAMRSADGWSYMFGALSEDDAADLLVGARLLSSAPDGLMPWRGRPDSLKRGLVARIPL